MIERLRSVITERGCSPPYIETPFRTSRGGVSQTLYNARAREGRVMSHFGIAYSIVMREAIDIRASLL